MPSPKQPEGRGFPESDTLVKVPVVDYFVKHCNLETVGTPFNLPDNGGMAKGGFYESLDAFVNAQLQAAIEDFREESEQLVKTSGGKLPLPEWMHLRLHAPFTATVEVLPQGFAKLKLGPFDKIQKYPEDKPRTVWAKYQMAVQGESEDEPGKVKVLAVLHCECMSKAAGFSLKGSESAIKDLEKQISSKKILYFRRLNGFNFMSLSPLISLQNILAHRADIRGSLVEMIWFSSAGGWEPKHSAILEKEKQMPSIFNEMQRRALALDALIPSGPVLIQGPPGTGKSHLIGNGLLHHAVQRGETILVCCNSNCAVDSVLEKVITSPHAASVKALSIRTGTKEKVAKVVLQQVNPQIFVQDKDAALALLKKGEKKVMFTTLYNATKLSGESSQFANAFDTVVIDEAGQIEDQKVFTLLHACRARAKKVILVGDHKQLQPYVGERVRSFGFGTSSLERLINVSHAKPQGFDPLVSYVMLEVQHRMPAQVRSLVSDLFYKSQLRDGPQLRFLKLKANQKQLEPIVIGFDLCYSDAFFSLAQRSLANEHEAKATKKVYDFFHGNFLNENGKLITSKDIAVLSPYNHHKNLLRTEIAGVPRDMWAKFENMDTDKLDGEEGGDEMTTRARNIDTVDKFQGSEREVVIINPTSKKSDSRCGDPHFINVACSRSKNVLVFVGCLTSLALSDDKRNWTAIKDKLDVIFTCQVESDVDKYLRELGAMTEGGAFKRQRTE